MSDDPTKSRGFVAFEIYERSRGAVPCARNHTVEQHWKSLPGCTRSMWEHIANKVILHALESAISNPSPELVECLKTAHRLLDEPNSDPDDQERMMARQLIRSVDRTLLLMSQIDESMKRIKELEESLPT